MRQSSTEEDLWSIFVQQHMGLTCLVIKRPWCVPFCLTEEEKAAHAYIMGVGGGNYFEITFFFSFGLCDSFACWWKIDVNHSPWLLSNIHSLYTHYSSVLIYSHSILILTLLLCSLFSSPYFTQFHFIQMSPFSLTTLTTKTKIYLRHCTACKLYFYWVVLLGIIQLSAHNLPCLQIPSLLPSSSSALWGHPE